MQRSTRVSRGRRPTEGTTGHTRLYGVHQIRVSQYVAPYCIAVWRHKSVLLESLTGRAIPFGAPYTTLTKARKRRVNRQGFIRSRITALRSMA